MKKEDKNLDRRYFLKSSALAGAFLGLSPGLIAGDKEKVKNELEKGMLPGEARGKSVRGMTVAPISQLKVAFI